MYYNNGYNQSSIPTSEIERSRRYASGVYPDYFYKYPDYSCQYPVQTSIINASVSSAQRYGGVQDSSTSRDSVATNIRTIAGYHDNEGKKLPSFAVNAQSSVPYKLDLGNFISNLNNQDPFQDFILNPHEYTIANAMFRALACKDLPHYLREVEFGDWPMEQARNILGILCKDILPEDERLFNKLCASLEKIEGDINKEMSLGKDMAILLHKYGKVPLYRHVDTYLECCRKVWHYYNQGHTVNPSDDQIFTSNSVCCIEVTHAAIMRLIRPKQVWGDVISIGLNFKNACCALGATIKTNPAVTLSAESITETFSSIYLNNHGSSTTTPNNHDAESIDSTRSQNAWQRAINHLCCGT